MKKVMTLLLVLALASPAFSQKKGKVDPKDVTIDSLTQINGSLTMQLDSISKERDLYYGVYNVIIEKVMKYPFDPAKTAYLIDSLSTGRESTMLGLKTNADSLSILLQENQKLKVAIDSLTASYADNTVLVKELKQLKELLDAKIITQEDFDAKKSAIMEQWK